MTASTKLAASWSNVVADAAKLPGAVGWGTTTASNIITSSSTITSIADTQLSSTWSSSLTTESKSSSLTETSSGVDTKSLLDSRQELISPSVSAGKLDSPGNDFYNL